MYIRIFLLLLVVCPAPYGEEWYPFSMEWNQAPVDISYVLDPPAGKHGFLGTKKDRLIFEDGTTIRFFGTILSGSACFPRKDQATEIAQTLAHFGINLVRFQNIDAPWVEPNLITSDSSNEINLNSELMDRLDYFLIQLKQQGIYAYFDGLDAMDVEERSASPEIPLGIGAYLHFVPDFHAMYESFLYEFWTHRNRYSMPSIQYRDDPMIVMMQLFSDHSLSQPFSIQPPLDEHVYVDWDNWSQMNSINEELTPDTPMTLLQPFYTYVMARTQSEIKRFLRLYSVKALIAGTGNIHGIIDLYAQKNCDVSLQEGVWNQGSEPYPQFANHKLLEATTAMDLHLFKRLAFGHIKGKPFIVNEWKNTWPNEYRAELPLWIAAKASEQEWNGIISSPYRISFKEEDEDVLTPIQLGNDPCLMGLFPAAALLFHQNEISRRRTVEMALSESLLTQEEPITPESVQTTKLVQHYQVQTHLDRKPSGSRVFAPTQPEDLQSYLRTYKRHPSFYHDPERGLVVINTPKAQALIGDLRRAEDSDLNNVVIQTKEPFAVFSINSLDNQPISKSNDLLITLVSQAQNQGFRSHAFRNESRVLQTGHAPLLIKSTPARLFFKLNHFDWKIEALSRQGEVIELIPYQIQNKQLSFRVGIHGTLYYRLKRE